MSIASEIERIKTNISNAYEVLEEKGAILPSQYQEVEYIESTGTQWIDTGVLTNTDVKMEAVLKCAENENKPNYSGVVYSSNAGWIAIGDYNNGQLCSFFATSSRVGATINFDTDFHKYYVSNGLQKIDNISTSYTVTSDMPNILNIFLFKGNVNFTATFAYKQTIKYAKIWNGDELVRYMIPCYRKSDNEAGLYDLVNGVFYTNSGTGQFTIGEEVDKNSNNLSKFIDRLEIL